MVFIDSCPIYSSSQTANNLPVAKVVTAVRPKFELKIEAATE